MATQFIRGTANTGLIPQYWSQQLFKFGYAANPLKPYMGTGADSIIQVNMDLSKKQGDQITFGLRKLLYGSGQTDDGTYSGNEEAMAYNAFQVPIHERGHSVVLSGKMTEKSALTNLRSNGKDALGEWIGRTQAADIIASLSGLKTMSFAGQVIGNSGPAADGTPGTYTGTAIATVTQVAPAYTAGNTAARYFCGGAAPTTPGTIARVASVASASYTAHQFTSGVIEYLKRMAALTITSTGVPICPIRPIMVEGRSHYLCLIDRLMQKSLLSDTNFQATCQMGAPRGLEDNPLFAGEDVYRWNNVVIRICDLLHSRLGNGTYAGPGYFDSTGYAVASGVTVVRGLFLGAQAACMAWGQMPSWSDGFTDPPHNTKWAVHSDFIYGVKKTNLGSTTTTATITEASDSEFGCIIFDCAVA